MIIKLTGSFEFGRSWWDCFHLTELSAVVFLLASSFSHGAIMAETSDVEQLLVAFKKFAVHGDTKATGKELNGKNWAKLCKDCKIIDSKNVTATDVDIVFSKVK